MFVEKNKDVSFYSILTFLTLDSVWSVLILVSITILDTETCVHIKYFFIYFIDFLHH